MKKTILFVLICSLMTGVLFAGGGRGDKAGSTVGAGSLIPITFSRTQNSTEESDIFSKLKDESITDNRWTRLIRDELGIDVQYLWIAPNAEQATQKFNAAVAAGTIPDIVGVNKIDLKNLVEADLLVNIAPYYEQLASPLLKSMISAGGERAIQACTFDGVQYGIPYIDCDIETAQLLWLRQDWLNELKLQPPKTIEDLKSIIRAFNRKVGTGAVGLSLSNDLYGAAMGIKGWANAYGAYPGYWIDDGTGRLVYGSTTPGMKRALESLAGLYQEGLIDREFYVIDGNKAAEAIINDKCGVMYGWHASSLWPLQDNIDVNPKADWRPYMLVTERDGQKIKPGINMMTSSWYVVSKKCKNPESLIQLLNLYVEKVFDPDKNQYAYYANPGGGLEGVWRLSPVSLNSADKNQQTALAIAKPLETGNPGSLYGEQLSMYEYSYAAQQGNTTLWGWNRVFGKDGSQMVLIDYKNNPNVELVWDQFYGVATETMIARKATLDTMLAETFFKIISGQVSPSQFDTVVNSWLQAGGRDMTNEVNAWYQEQR
jgi:putative aldouronate transport system substrate-binding protein